jgi:uncharacterized membrane protein
MVEFVRAGPPAQFSVTARPNFVLGSPGLRLAMLVLLPWSIVMGTIFLTMGVWPVTLFLLLPISGLVLAFQHLERHAGDFERLVLDNDRLILDSHTPDQDEHLEFNSYWVQIALLPTAVGGGTTLTLRSHGKEVAFGHLLSDEERAAVSRELSQRLARIRQ